MIRGHVGLMFWKIKTQVMQAPTKNITNRVAVDSLGIIFL